MPSVFICFFFSDLWKTSQTFYAIEIGPPAFYSIYDTSHRIHQAPTQRSISLNEFFLKYPSPPSALHTFIFSLRRHCPGRLHNNSHALYNTCINKMAPEAFNFNPNVLPYIHIHTHTTSSTPHFYAHHIPYTNIKFNTQSILFWAYVSVIHTHTRTLP